MNNIKKDSLTSHDVLDHPIWHSLSTKHQSFAEGNVFAKKYLSDVAPLGAIASQSVEAYDALGEIVAEGEAAALFLDTPPVIPSPWILSRTFEIHQMVRESPDDAEGATALEALTEADVSQMLALTELTEPGPFRRRTIELGGYLGIFSTAGRLVAMAGQRLRLTGFTEISAVCTHPDHRGNGYARSLVSTLISKISRRGEIPFLHVKADNAAAIALYASLGFKLRRSLHLAVVKNGASFSPPIDHG